MDIHDTNIAAHFVTCMICNKVWRTPGVMRCPRCARAYGLPFLLDLLRNDQLMDAMREFENENKENEDDILRMAIAMEDNCSWYDEEDPWYSQTCWMCLREYLRENPPTPHIQRAMEIFEIQFRASIQNVDEDGFLIPHEIRAPLLMG